MTPSTLAIIALVLQLTPEVINYLNIQQMAKDIPDDQLAILKSHSHESVQALATLLEEAKTT